MSSPVYTEGATSSLSSPQTTTFALQSEDLTLIVTQLRTALTEEFNQTISAIIKEEID